MEQWRGARPPRELQPGREEAVEVGQKEGKGVGRDISGRIFVHAVAIRHAVRRVASSRNRGTQYWNTGPG